MTVSYEDLRAFVRVQMEELRTQAKSIETTMLAALEGARGNLLKSAAQKSAEERQEAIAQIEEIYNKYKKIVEVRAIQKLREADEDERRHLAEIDALERQELLALSAAQINATPTKQ